MTFAFDLFTCLVFLLVLTCGLPIPRGGNTASFGALPLAYRRRVTSSPDGSSSVAGYGPGRPQVWGGTPANPSICYYPNLWTGMKWWIMGCGALLLVIFYGVLAFATWGVMSVDLPRLTVWSRTGGEQRRRFARKVLKIRNRPDWLLVSLVVVSVIILEVLPIFWGHLFMASRASSYLTSNVVILVSQVGPTFVMPIFHLEISGRCTGLIRLVMWLSAPITLLPAYALRQIKQWRKRGQQPHMDGILPLDELIEFIHLHEKGQGNGGTLEDHVGKAMRDLLKGQISAEASSTHVETGRFQPIQFINSVSSTSVQWCGQDPAVGTEHTSRPTSVLSHGQEESRAIDIETTSRPTSIRSHGQEASTAIEDVPVSGLRKRGERSTECYEPVAPMVSMQMPELVKDPTHTSSTLVNDRHVGQGTPNARRKMPLRWRYPLQNLSISVTPRKQRVSMRESYRNERKDSGLVTDSFLL